jgi:ABC-type glycerol-3-phosphate transport system substrate-binding protein
MFVKFLKAVAAGALLVGALAAPAMAQKTTLTIYTSLENDQLADFKKAIEDAVPEVEVAWVRDSTGVITARFLAEKDNQRPTWCWATPPRRCWCSRRWDCSKPTSPRESTP